MPACPARDEEVRDEPHADISDPDPDPEETGPGCPAFVRLGSNLRDLRTAAGMTLESLAAAASGRDGRAEHSWVWKMEAGRSQVGILRGLCLAGALGVTIDELLEGVYWNPGEIATTPDARRAISERLRGYLTVLPAGEPPFENPAETSSVRERAEVARAIAINVRDARARRHLRQRDLGLPDTAGAGLVESGGREPELLGLRTMARALEVPTEFLLRGMRWDRPEGSDDAPRRLGRRHDFHANDTAVARLWREDMTAGEIAAELGLTRPSVEGIVRRLRARGVDLPTRKPGRRRAGVEPHEDSPAVQDAAAVDAAEQVYARVANNLRRLRLDSGLGLEQLAEATESSRITIRRAETRGSDLDLTTLVRLAAGLRVPVTAITRGITWDTRARRLIIEPDGHTDRGAGFGRRLGANIRRARRRLRLSQEDVAARTGVYRRHLSAIEMGGSLPKPITLLVLSHALQTDLGDLLAGTCDWYVRPLPPPEYAEGEVPPSKAERQARLLRLWGDGAGRRSIAEALDMAPSSVGGLINELRAIGIEVPYRNPPTTSAQLAGRLRRRRGIHATRR